jgi:hypothetical protein
MLQTQSRPRDLSVRVNRHFHLLQLSPPPSWLHRASKLIRQHHWLAVLREGTNKSYISKTRRAGHPTSHPLLKRSSDFDARRGAHALLLLEQRTLQTSQSELEKHPGVIMTPAWRRDPRLRLHLLAPCHLPETCAS